MLAAATRNSFCFLILSIIACPLQAEIYKWVDTDGTIQYTDTPPAAQQETLEITGSISSYTSTEIMPTDSAESDSTSKSKFGVGKPATNKRVVMYSAPWCGVCKTAKKYFEQHNISYTEYDIDSNPKAKTDFDKMKGRGVPIILVGESRMNGFSPGGFEQLYHD